MQVGRRQPDSVRGMQLGHVNPASPAADRLGSPHSKQRYGYVGLWVAWDSDSPTRALADYAAINTSQPITPSPITLAAHGNRLWDFIGFGIFVNGFQLEGDRTGASARQVGSLFIESWHGAVCISLSVVQPVVQPDDAIDRINSHHTRQIELPPIGMTVELDYLLILLMARCL